MKINKKQKKTLWIGLIILGIIFLLNGDTGCCDDSKKEGIGDTFNLILGGAIIIGGVMLGFVTGGAGFPVAIPMFIIGGLIAAPGLIGSVGDIFNPSSPTIPVWAYIGGFFVLIVMVIGKKK